MRISEIISELERIAPPSYQEDYDNSGLIVGKPQNQVNRALISLDCTEAIVDEAINQKCELIIAHHPIVFSGLKRFNGKNYVERTVEKAIKNDIAIYAIHTNLDNVSHQGVNSRIAANLGLKNTSILAPKSNKLLKLVTYAPKDDSTTILNALFAAGAGKIGNYSACSFSSEGFGTFKGNEQSNPSIGTPGVQHTENEMRMEVILRSHQQNTVLQALKKAHPYEEVAYELYPTLNADQDSGSGMIGELDVELQEQDFLKHLKSSMDCDTIRYTSYDKTIKRVAICGGSGSFLLQAAKAKKADAFVTADFKYHQFFDAEEELMICDIGHYESEKFTIELLYDILTEKFPTFAVLKTEVDTNPIQYYH